MNIVKFQIFYLCRTAAYSDIILVQLVGYRGKKSYSCIIINLKFSVLHNIDIGNNRFSFCIDVQLCFVSVPQS